MIFPDAQRVIYKNNPLVEVVCQIRYPTILKIENELPVNFQEKIRQRFPIFKQVTNIQLPQELSQLTNLLAQADNRTYTFSTQDEKWTLNLTRDFLALTTSHYTKWEEFIGNLELVLSAFVEEYQPSFFLRIGLRYINVVKRATLGMPLDTPWIDLINPQILGLYASNDANISKNILGNQSVALIDLGDDNKLRLQYGTVTQNDSDEIYYLIDNDFYVENYREADNGLQILNRFNRTNRNLFRWCITSKLHSAMEPTESAD
jgi:uncharacterized protein (TIGR04255 family)